MLRGAYSLRPSWMKKAVPAGEEIYPLLLGVNFVRIARGVRRQRHKFIVARPERKLILHVLRFGNVNRRMTGLLGALLRQVKRQLGGAIAVGGDQENRLPGSGFEVAAQFCDRCGGRAPTAEPIARVAAAAPDSRVTHHQTNEKQTHRKTDHEPPRLPNFNGSCAAALTPIGNRENAEAEKGEPVPVRRGGFVDREERVEKKTGSPNQIR